MGADVSFYCEYWAATIVSRSDQLLWSPVQLVGGESRRKGSGFNGSVNNIRRKDWGRTFPCSLRIPRWEKRDFGGGGVGWKYDAVHLLRAFSVGRAERLSFNSPLPSPSTLASRHVHILCVSVWIKLIILGMQRRTFLHLMYYLHMVCMWS